MDWKLSGRKLRSWSLSEWKSAASVPRPRISNFCHPERSGEIHEVNLSAQSRDPVFQPMAPDGSVPPLPKRVVEKNA